MCSWACDGVELGRSLDQMWGLRLMGFESFHIDTEEIEVEKYVKQPIVNIEPVYNHDANVYSKMVNKQKINK